MAEKLDPNEMVSIEEIAALVELLEQKELLTRKEGVGMIRTL